MEEATSRHFGWIDYIIFGLALVLSSLIGIYQAWKGAGSSTANYLLGGKSMGIFPVAMSLAATMMSTQAMIGVPTEVYLTGAMLLWTPVTIAIVVPIAAYVYLPLFQDLGILSINQYLELRFHRFVRRMSSGLSAFAILLYLSIVTYGPSLALSQVTGLHVYVSATITFAVGTFYTTIGGMKAVVLSDTIQIILMIGSMATLVIKGVLDIGIENVWERNLNSGRLDFFITDPDPTTNKTVWSLVFGAFFFWLPAYGTNQGTFQWFSSLPTRRKGQQALMLNILVISCFFILCCLTGLVIYSKYFDCDPFRGKLIEKADQIVPYFVMDTLGSIPGLPGLFVAGIFSASLSTLSSCMNGTALTILEDFVRPFHPNLSDKAAAKISKGISFSIGLIGYFLVFLISNVKTIFEIGYSFSAASLGMTMGIFTLGLLNPWCNWIGAMVGMVVSYTSVLSLGIFTQAARSKGLLPNKQMKPTSILNCSNLNETFRGYSNNPLIETDEPFYLLRISLFWYALIGTLIVFIVGTIVSFLTGPQDIDQLNSKLVFRFMRRWTRRKQVLQTDQKNEEEIFAVEKQTDLNTVAL